MRANLRGGTFPNEIGKSYVITSVITPMIVHDLELSSARPL